MPETDSKLQLSITEVRELAVRLNNPNVPVEDRQKALTSLVVELCDRLTEYTGATASGLRRLSEAQHEIAQRTEDCIAAVQGVGGGSEGITGSSDFSNTETILPAGQDGTVPSDIEAQFAAAQAELDAQRAAEAKAAAKPPAPKKPDSTTNGKVKPQAAPIPQTTATPVVGTMPTTPAPAPAPTEPPPLPTGDPAAIAMAMAGNAVQGVPLPPGLIVKP